MKNKRKIIAIVIGFLVCTSITYGYFIGRKNYQRNVLTEKNNKIADIKAAEALKDETQKQKDFLVKTEDYETSALANEPNLKHNDKGLPVLMYHAIGYEKGNTARLPKENFKEQMKYLKDNGYVTITLDEAYDFFQRDKAVPEKALVLTFDDGYVDNYVEALPILKEYGFTATIFVITDAVDKNPGYMNVEQLKEMEASGMDIQSHAVRHDHLAQLSYEKQLETLKGSKSFLKKSLNKEIKYFAYPFGEYSKDTLKAVKDAGYTMAFTTGGRWSDKSDGILTLDRVFISGSASLDVFIDRITNPNYKF